MVDLGQNWMSVTGAKISMTGASIVAAIAISGIIYWLQQRKKEAEKVPTEWKPVGTVSRLFIYPLKSGKALEVKEADCTSFGLKEVTNGPEKFSLLDRYFMVYQENSQKFLTARQKTTTLLISVRSAGPNAVTLSAPNCSEITFNVVKEEGTRVKCSMHYGEEIEVIDCGDDVAVWLSEFIYNKRSGLRLGYYPDLNERQRSLDKGIFRKSVPLRKYMKDSDFGVYSDIASYMLLSENSIEELKERLPPEEANEVTVRQFRPNIVVSGSELSAYVEDEWQWVKIGQDVIMRGFKPCTRCLMVTLDPDKGVANPTKEPLLTLKKYRQVTDPVWKDEEGTSPAFGRYFGLYDSGKVSVGDTIYVPA